MGWWRGLPIFQCASFEMINTFALVSILIPLACHWATRLKSMNFLQGCFSSCYMSHKWITLGGAITWGVVYFSNISWSADLLIMVFPGALVTYCIPGWSLFSFVGMTLPTLATSSRSIVRRQFTRVYSRLLGLCVNLAGLQWTVPTCVSPCMKGCCCLITSDCFALLLSFWMSDQGLVVAFLQAWISQPYHTLQSCIMSSCNVEYSQYSAMLYSDVINESTDSHDSCLLG